MWTITRDIINTGDGGKPKLVHSRGWTEDMLLHAFPFQLRDDDDNLYFEGASTDNDSEAAFEPLDEFGVAYGCTNILYRNEKGVWEVL